MESADDNNVSPLSRVIEGIYMAIERKVDIINMSFSIDKYSASFEKAIQDAADAGILVVAAAGNTGDSSDASVQYPAAFKDVLAVGSVDKKGDVAASSSKGEDLDLVAPGELVRSTGMFDSDIVTSGTSLAAPQVSGAAALLLAQLKDASPDLVKEVLCQSANLYGKTDEYGAGLVDVKVALDKYDEIKASYEADTESKPVVNNDSAVTVYKDTGCVEGCWSKDNHENAIEGNYPIVKRGARFSDKEDLTNYEDGHELSKPLYKIAGMCHNPWWHGYYRYASLIKEPKTFKGKYANNYVACYIYITRLANSYTQSQTVYVPGGINSTVKSEITDDINSILWRQEFGGIPDSNYKRDFLWGMALHSLADSFAHSTYAKGEKIVHSDSDNINHIPQRWEHAQEAVSSALGKYKTSGSSGVFRDFESVLKASAYKMINIKDYMNTVAGNTVASSYKNVNKDLDYTK